MIKTIHYGKYKAEFKEDGIEYSLDLDYEVESYRIRQTHDSPEESGLEVHIGKIRRCVIKDSGKTYIVSKVEMLPDKYFEAIVKTVEASL